MVSSRISVPGPPQTKTRNCSMDTLPMEREQRSPGRMDMCRLKLMGVPAKA